MVLEKEKKMSKGIITGAFVLTVSTLVVKLLGVLYKIPIARVLGEEGMGYFNSAYTVYAFFYLLCTAGVPKAVMILVSESQVKGEDEFKIVRNALNFFVLLGFSFSIIFGALGFPLAKLIGNANSGYAMLAISPTILFVAASGVLRGYLSANMKFSEIAITQIVEGIIKLLLGLVMAGIAIKKCLPLPVVVAAALIGVVIGSFASFILLYVGCKSKNSNIILWQKGIRSLDTTVLKRIFRISIPITLSAAVMSITGVLDLAMIMHRMNDIGYDSVQSSALFGNYTTMAVPMFNLAVALITPISVSYMTAYARAHAENDNALLNKSVNDSVSFSMLVAAPMIIGLLIYPKEILKFLYGDLGIDVGAKLTMLLMPSVAIMSLLLIVNSALEACGKVRLTVFSMILGGAVKAIAGYFLMGNDEIGIFGAPISTLLGYLTSVIISSFALTRVCGLRINMLEPCIITHACALVAVLISRFVYSMVVNKAGDNFTLLMCIVISAVLYVLFVYFCGIFVGDKGIERSKCTKLA